ncbi:MAG TPA: magnesium transporter [Candidatus Woesebacteria bacterium]|nr:magnesium transporter [Candidatus Woesebacteria bacterium]
MNKHVITAKSAIHLTITTIPVFSPDYLVKECKKDLFHNGATYDSINYIYITSSTNVLKGVISVQELINADDNKKLKEIMETKLVSVFPYTHREKIVQLALKNNLKAIPVIDKEQKLLGVIPSDTILTIANNEMTEELLLLEGINSKEFASISTIHNSPFSLLLKRLPWLVIGLLGGIVAAEIISYFESIIGEDVLLLSFIPLMVYVSDAVGSQSQTIYIRYIAVHNEVNFLTYMVKELRLGILLSLSLSFLLFMLTSFLYSPHIAFILGLALCITILSSIVIAIAIPWILLQNHKDPAVGSGPFATILRDLISIIIFFVVTQFFY